jgi:teichuronic acid exporter
LILCVHREERSLNIREQALGGILWTSIERTGATTLQFVVLVVLARFLSPADFGLVGMIGVFLMISQSFVDSGFGTALVQRGRTTRLEESSVFYFNVAVAILCTTLIWIGAPVIASFYREPALIGITRGMSIVLITGALGSVQYTLLTRSFGFRSIAIVTVSSTVISGGIGVTMAVRECGVWSLVAMSIANSGATSVLYWIVGRWRPEFRFSFGTLRDYFPFGSRLLVSGVIDQVFTNAYPIILGKLFSADVVGYYSRAQGFYQLATNTPIGIVSRVFFPTLCAVSRDTARLRGIVERGMLVLVFLVLPAMVGLFSASRPLVVLILGEKWLPTAGILQVLCFMGIFLPLHSMNLQVLQVMGRSDLYLKLEVIKKITLICSILLSFRFGLHAMLVFHVLFVSFPGFVINSFYSGRLMGLGARQQFGLVAPTFAAGLLMGSFIYPIQWLSLPAGVILGLQTTAGVIVYLAASRALKLRALRETLDLLSHYLPKQYERRLRSALLGYPSVSPGV